MFLRNGVKGSPRLRGSAITAGCPLLSDRTLSEAEGEGSRRTCFLIPPHLGTGEGTLVAGHGGPSRQTGEEAMLSACKPASAGKRLTAKEGARQMSRATAGREGLNPLKSNSKNIPQVCRSFTPLGAQWSHDVRADDRRADNHGQRLPHTCHDSRSTVHCFALYSIFPVFPFPRSRRP